MLDPLGPMRIRPRDLPSLLPWFWKFWRVSNMPKVEAIAGMQALLMRTVAADYDEILAGAKATHLKVSRGAIHVYDTEKEYLAEQWKRDLSARLGFETQRLEPAQLKAMVPSLKLEDGVAMLMPDWQHLLNPAKATELIAEHCFTNGGKWLQDRITSASANSSGVHLQTESGRRIKADKLVVAAGAWSNFIAEQLDHKVSMIAKRGYHAMLSNPGIDLRYPVMSLSRVFVMTPLEDGLRIAGTAEFAALDAAPDYRRAKALLKQASHYLEGLQVDDASEWMGSRPMMADSIPVISMSPRHQNVFYAFGHGHYGLTQGPTTGRIISAMVAGHEPEIDLAAFRFDR